MIDTHGQVREGRRDHTDAESVESARIPMTGSAKGSQLPRIPEAADAASRSPAATKVKVAEGLLFRS
jgi:hypothetical protein